MDLTRKSENARRKPQVMLAHVRDIAVDRIRWRIHLALSETTSLPRRSSIVTGQTHSLAA